MHKRAFMLGDSFIWGTEQMSPDGKECSYPPRKYNRNINLREHLKLSQLPSEKTWPYFIDDWHTTVNLADTGHGIDLVKHRFTHEVFPILEPDDTVFVYLPTLFRKKYTANIARLMNDITKKDELIYNDIKSFLLDNSGQQKFNRNWFEVFMEKLGNELYFTDKENDSKEFLNNLNDQKKKEAFIYIDSILDLTIHSTDNMIFDIADCILTLELMAEAKGCSNVFYVLETNGFSKNIKDNILKAIGKPASSRIICWHWVNHMLKLRVKKKKTEKEWIHQEGHFTDLAHRMFANDVKDQVNRLRKE